MSKLETYKDQCKQKRRPRICWESLKEQIPKENINIIFEGNLKEIF
jgi:hypothetical protein